MNRAKRMAVIFLCQLGLLLVGGAYCFAIVHFAITDKPVIGIAIGLCGMLISAWWLSKE